MATALCLTLGVGYSVEKPVSASETVMNETIKGDVNADGEFNIADIVLFQKWLLACPDVELKNWKAADLCKDDRLDVFDMVMMRRELISTGIVKRSITKEEFIKLLFSKDEFTWSDFEQYKSEDIGSGIYILKYKIVDENGDNFYLYVTGSDMNEKPESIYLTMDGKDEKKDIYEFRDELGGFGDLYDKITWEIAPIADGVGFRDTIGKEYVITSTKELGDYFYSIYADIIDCDVDCPENETVTEFLHKYNDTFFENNILLMKPFIKDAYTGYSEINGVECKNESLSVYFYIEYIWTNQPVPNYKIPHLALVTVPKSMYHQENVEWLITRNKEVLLS